MAWNELSILAFELLHEIEDGGVRTPKEIACAAARVDKMYTESEGANIGDKYREGVQETLAECAELLHALDS